MTLKEQKGVNMENDNIVITDEALDNFLDFTSQIYSKALYLRGLWTIPKVQQKRDIIWQDEEKKRQICHYQQMMCLGQFKALKKNTTIILILMAMKTNTLTDFIKF